MTETSKQEAAARLHEATGGGAWWTAAQQVAELAQNVALFDSPTAAAAAAESVSALHIDPAVLEETLHPLVVEAVWSPCLSTCAKQRLVEFVGTAVASGALPLQYLHRLFDFLHGSALSPDQSGATHTQLLQILMRYLPQHLLHPTIISQYQQRLKVLQHRHSMRI
jgi:hypothetical protein